MKIKPILALIWGLLFCVPVHAAQLSIGIGTTANDGTGDTARVAFGKVNTNFTEIYNSVTGLTDDLGNLSLDAVSKSADNTLAGKNVFDYIPIAPVNDLAGGTVLTVGKSHSDVINVARTYTFSGTPSSGNPIILRLTVTGNPTITFPASKRSGENVGAITSLPLWEGLHTLTWAYFDADGAGPNAAEWWLYDSLYARNNRSTLDPTAAADVSMGYGVGSEWTNTATKILWKCSDAADGAAVWKAVGSGGTATREYILPIQPDETTTLTTGTGKYIFRAPANMTITGVRASLATVSSSGLPTFDVNVGDTPATILSTKLTVDASEKTSVTAAAAPVITSGNVAVDGQVSVDVDVAGTGASGAKVYLTAIPWDGIVPVTDYTTNLIARVGFEEGSATSYSSTVGSGMTGTAAVASEVVAGKVGTHAVRIEPTEIINFGDVNHFDGLTSITWMIWFKAESSGSNARLLGKISNLTNYTFESMVSSLVPTVTTNTSATPTKVTSTGSAVSANVWHHYAVTYDGTTQRLYLDGVQVDSDAQTGGLYNSSGTLNLGPSGTSSVTISLDDFRIYNEVLDTTKLGTIISAANP